MHDKQGVTKHSQNEPDVAQGLWVPYPDVNRSSEPNLPPDPDDLNDLRAQRADDALTSFARQHGASVRADLETLKDLLSRMGHWCDRNKLQMAEVWRMAAASYSEDTGGHGVSFLLS